MQHPTVYDTLLLKGKVCLVHFPLYGILKLEWVSWDTASKSFQEHQAGKGGKVVEAPSLEGEQTRPARMDLDRVYLDHSLIAKETKERTQGRNLEAETYAEATKECCLLGSLLSVALLSLLSYMTQGHLTGVVPPCGLDPTTSITNRVKALQTCLQACLVE